jgi:hypothetical protein
MKEKEDEIIDLLKSIQEDVKYIKAKMDKDSNVLNRHIHFIESIYDTMKSPIQYICNSFTRRKEITLPEIKDQESSNSRDSSDNI